MDHAISYLLRQGVFCNDLLYEQLSGGASGAALYSVTDSNGRYVLKVSRKSDREEDNTLADFAKEYAFYNLNKRLKLPFVPKTVYSEKHAEYGFILVMERFDSIPHSGWDRELQKKAVDLCAQLNSLDISLFSDLELKRSRIKIDRKAAETSYHLWLEVIRRHGAEFDEKMLAEIYHHLDVICPVLNVEPFRICHGDFHPENLITDGNQLYMIDWQNLHMGNSAEDISFFIQRGNGFGIQLNTEELFTCYAEKLSEYTGQDISVEQLMLENSASVLLTAFMFWAYYLKDAPCGRVEMFFHSMVEAYKNIAG